jgi:hypothetical protein
MIKTDDKKKYLISLEYIGVTVKEFITKPMTTAEFLAEFEQSYLAQEFPIFIEGNYKEISGTNNVEWDKMCFTNAMNNNPNLFVTWGIHYAKGE